MDEPPFAFVCGWRYPLLIIAKGGSFSTVSTLRLHSSTSLACGFSYEQKQGAPPGRTLKKSTDDSDMYNRALPVGNALFFFAGDMMSLFRLPSSVGFAIKAITECGERQDGFAKFITVKR